MADRGWAWATATGDGDAFEVVLYLTLHDELRRSGETRRRSVLVVGELAGSVLAVGARHEQLLVSGAYPQLAFAGEVAGLLSEPQSARGLPAAVIALAVAGGEPIGLGAIQDLAQGRYGPIDLDRRPSGRSRWHSPSRAVGHALGRGLASRLSSTSSAS